MKSENFAKSYFRKLYGIMIIDPVVFITLGKQKLLNKFKIKYVYLVLANKLHCLMSILKFHIWYRSQAILFRLTSEWLSPVMFIFGGKKFHISDFLPSRSSLFILYNFLSFINRTSFEKAAFFNRNNIEKWVLGPVLALFLEDNSKTPQTRSNAWICNSLYWRLILKISI